MPVIAMYLRLSQEDKKPGYCESGSICSQRKLIMDYIYQNNFYKNYNIIEFCDDGYTGTNINRPGMDKMLNEVKKNKIDCIIVKDLSRFSRDYIELGTYINYIFPFMGIRFISINDNYDSGNYKGHTASIDTEFKSLLYDLYSKDISAKVKASFENRCAKGEYIFGQVPFGYKKGNKDKNTIEINENEAVIVRYIFRLAAEGKSSVQIAKQLYNENIPPIKKLRNIKTPETKKIQTWSDSSIKRIISNRFYLGEMVYGKTSRQYVGSKSIIKLPQNQWKVIKGHHTPLVSVEIFEKAAHNNKPYYKRQHNKENLFAGKLFCGGCGYSMSYKKAGRYSKYRYFWCRKHSLLQIPECCTNYNADILEELVITALKKEWELRIDTERQKKAIEALFKQLLERLKKQVKDYMLKQQNVQLEKDLLYENYAFKNITEEEYKEKSAYLSEKIAYLHLMVKSTSQKTTQIKKEQLKLNSSAEQIVYYTGIEKMTQEIADIFIKKIYVYKDKSIEIEWSYSEI